MKRPTIRELLALDLNSVRTDDIDGRMRVAVMNISKACVNPYKGSEIPGSDELGLEPDRVYYLYRDPEELAAAAASSNGVQILRKHIPVNAEDHQPWDVVGAIGTEGRFEDPYLKNSGTFWVGDDIKGIKSGRKKQLSLGYHYRPEMTAGKIGDIPFDGVMRDIVVNHVALVEDGRAGPDVVVGDSAENLKMAKPTRFASLVALMAGTAITPMLAQDKKIDLMPIFKDVTAANWDAKAVTMALDGAIKGKLRKGLAHDVTMKHVADLMEHIPGEESMDESVSEPQHKAMEAAAHGKSTLGIPPAVGKEFAEADKGKDNLFMKKAMDWMASKGMDASEFEKHMGGDGMEMSEDEENEEAEEENEGERNPPDADKDKVGGGDRRGGKDKGRMGKDGQIVLTQHAFDQALAARDKATEAKMATKMQQMARDMRQAEAVCKAKVGSIDTLAFDSAEGLKRHTLKMLGCTDHETIHVSALDALLKAYPDAGAKPASRLAADGSPRLVHSSAPGADAVKRAAEIAPGLSHIKRGA